AEVTDSPSQRANRPYGVAQSISEDDTEVRDSRRGCDGWGGGISIESAAACGPPFRARHGSRQTANANPARRKAADRYGSRAGTRGNSRGASQESASQYWNETGWRRRSRREANGSGRGQSAADNNDAWGRQAANFRRPGTPGRRCATACVA